MNTPTVWESDLGSANEYDHACGKVHDLQWRAHIALISSARTSPGTDPDSRIFTTKPESDRYGL